MQVESEQEQETENVVDVSQVSASSKLSKGSLKKKTSATVDDLIKEQTIIEHRERMKYIQEKSRAKFAVYRVKLENQKLKKKILERKLQHESSSTVTSSYMSQSPGCSYPKDQTAEEIFKPGLNYFVDDNTLQDAQRFL